MRKSIVLGLILILMLPLLGIGQSFYAVRRDRKMTVNVGTGVTKYYGELVGDNELGKIKPNINIGLEYFLAPRISIRTDATWFQLSGSDADADQSRRNRNLSFVSNNVELSIGGAVQLFPDNKNHLKRPAFNVYGVMSVGLLYFNPKTEYEGKKVALQPLQTEGEKYSKFQFVIPMGIGARFKINPWTNLAVEGVYRETFTDYLDDISSRNYPDPNTLSSDLSVALSDRRRELTPDYPTETIRQVRGNPDNEDAYFILTAKLQFFIPSSIGSNSGMYKAKRTTSKHKGMYKTKKRRR